MDNKVLIIEDSNIVVEKLKILLGGIEELQIIGVVSDSYNAVKLINELKPDFVILDLSLKLGHGIKVLEEISTLPEIPYVMVLTNMNYQYYREKCIRLGARQFFDKAMEFEKVYEILSSKIRSSEHKNKQKECEVE